MKGKNEMKMKNKKIMNVLIICLALLVTSTITVPVVFAEEITSEEEKTLIITEEEVISAVSELFDEAGDIKDTVTLENIYNKYPLVILLPEGALREELLKKVGLAVDMYNARYAVECLFYQNGDILGTVTQDSIDYVKTLVDILPEGALKVVLQAEIDKSQDMLDAINAVKNIFDEFGAIKDIVIQESIDNIQVLVDVLPEGILKNDLQKNLDLAQDMLDARDAVKALFNEDGAIKNSVTLESIDYVQTLVDILPEGALKKEFDDKLSLASGILYIIDTVENLFDETGNIKDSATQEDIDYARVAVLEHNIIPDGELKEVLLEKLDLAQGMLNIKNSVEYLFDEVGNIKATVKQEGIDNAQALVNELPDGALKAELQTKIDVAQNELDAKNEVEYLFDEAGNIKNTVKQESIDNAQALVNELPDGALKAELQTKIDIAQNVLDAKNAVEYLFDEAGNIKNTVKQESIDNAQTLVNELPDGLLKAELQTKIDVAQNVLDVKNAVEYLFDEAGNIKDTVKQESIDNAQLLVNELPDGALKAELQKMINQAQKKLDLKSKSTQSIQSNNVVTTGDQTETQFFLFMLLISLVLICSIIIKRKDNKLTRIQSVSK